MSLSSDHNEKDYERLIEALTPRHAPVTDMKFAPPAGRLKSRLARLLSHAGRVAAVLAIGVGIGLLLSRPDREDQVVAYVSDRFQGTDASVYADSSVPFVARRGDDQGEDGVPPRFNRCQYYFPMVDGLSGSVDNGDA